MPQTAVDTAAFSEMKELMGDAFKDIIDMCLQSLPEQLTEIEMAINNQDADTLFHIAHKMKSSCGSIGAFGLAEKAEVIELIARSGSTQGTNEAFIELQSSLDEVLTLLKEEMN
jgi:HPt (histidine-containing phosphotransfer) domain-containing protein